MMEYEAGMDREQDEKKLQAGEVAASETCVAVCVVAEDLIIEISRLFGEPPKDPEVKKYAEVASYYLQATQAYAALWAQRQKCAALPIEGDLEEDEKCADRAESLEARAENFWRRAERAHNALLGVEPQGGGK
jgi:hypothetical protein